MRWKNLPTWLKGGIIGITIYLIWAIFWWIVIITSSEPEIGWVGFFIYGPGFPLLFTLTKIFPMLVIFEDFLLSFCPIFTAAVVGSLIGLVYGKIKSKK